MAEMPEGFTLLARVPCECSQVYRFACIHCGGSGLREQEVPVTPEVYEFLTRGSAVHVSPVAKRGGYQPSAEGPPPTVPPPKPGQSATTSDDVGGGST